MSKKDNFKFPFEQFHAQLEQIGKLYTSPLIDTVAQQQALLRSFEQPLAAFEKSVLPFEQFRAQSEKIGMLFSSPVIEMAQRQQNIYGNLVADAFKSPLHNLVNSFSKTYGTEFANLIQSSTTAAIRDDFSSITKSLGLQFTADIGVQLSAGFEPLISSLDAIRINSKYVDIPAELIPDDFEYDEEILSPVQHGNSVKVPFKVAQDLIDKLLLPILAAYIVYLLTASPTAWQKQYHQEEMENDAKLIQQNEIIIEQNKTIIEQNDRTIQQNDEMIEIQHKLYVACLKRVETLEAIYYKLDSESNSPEVDLLTSSAECHSADAQSNADQAEPAPVFAEPTLDSTEPEPHPAESQPSTTPDSHAESEQPS